MKMRRISMNEQGMSSIVVSFALVAILSLISLGFAQYARREQRQAFDRQLNTQAYYAAESGVNDALAAVVNYKVQNTGALIDTNCAPEAATSNRDIKIAGSDTVLYSCQLVDTVVPDIVVDSISTKQKRDQTNEIAGRYFVIDPVSASDGSPVAIRGLEIEWETDTDHGYFPPYSPGDSFLPYSGTADTWSAQTPNGTRPDIIRAIIYDNTGVPDGPEAKLEARSVASQKVLYLYPAAGSTDPILDYDAYPSGSVVPASCQAVSLTRNYACRVRFTKAQPFPGRLPPPNDTKPNLAIGLMNTYRQLDSTSVRIRTFVDINLNASALLKDSQFRIDVTGKAADVRRRIQVRVPFGKSQRQTANYVLESAESICKVMQVGPATSPNPNILPSYTNVASPYGSGNLYSSGC